MKQNKNNEMDHLLRDLVRRERLRSVSSEDHSAKHLDADELNSYAEQALPAAARARYTSHLAECESCRKIVSDLTSAAGASAKEQSVSQKISTGLLQKFGALFSPARLRYAVPALALVAFVAIGFVVLRQQRQPDLVAENQTVAPLDRSVVKEPADSPAQLEDRAAPNDEQQLHDGQIATNKARDNLAKSVDRNETPSGPTSTDSASAADRDASAGKAAGEVAQPAYAPEPPAAPAPKPQTTENESRTEVAARQKKEADKNLDERAREQEGARARRDDSQNQVATTQTQRDAPAVQSEEKRRSPEMARLGSGVGAKTKDDKSDTRTVSGRRFRRQGGVWIDTSYELPRATTVVTRGTEQFRALVADEPGIRDIADQLHGEVVVVWKGRAYRIR